MSPVELLAEAEKLLAQRNYAAAETGFSAILKSHPQYARAAGGLGVCLFVRREFSGAIRAFRNAVKLEPGNGVYWTQLAEAQKAAGEKRSALRSYEEAMRLLPRDSRLPTNAGSLAFELGAVEEALGLTRRALKLDPNDMLALRNLASMAAKSGDPAEALSAARTLAARAAIPPMVTVATQLHLLGNALTMNGATDDGISTLQRALEEAPADADIRHSLALAYLAAGDHGRGFALLPARFDLPGYAENAVAKSDQPRWDGSDPSGKRVMVQCEQGAGDAVQFCRYLPELARRGATVLVACGRPLVGLLRTVEGVSGVFDGPCGHDVAVPMMDLPLRLGLTGGSAGWTGPYIAAGTARTAELRAAISVKAGGRTTVALCWSGNPDQPVNRRRSVPTSLLGTLKLDGVCFVSAQKVPPPGQGPPKGLIELDPTPELENFADTAALLAGVDLVVTTDTSVAHLAGAMGLPAWVLLHHPAPHWPYGATGERTAWYPTLRLFRQRTYGDWGPVLQDVRRRLGEHLRA